MIFDDIFETVGAFGLFQLYAFLLIGTFSFWTNDANVAPFIVFQLNHWCHVPQLANQTDEQRRYIGIPLKEDGSYEQCQQYDLDFSSYTDEDLSAWNRTAILTGNEAVIPCSSWDYDFSDYYSSAVNKFDLVCGQEWLVSFASTLYLSGGLVGAFTCGLLSDRYGRKLGLMFTTTNMIVGGLMCAFAPNYTLFAIGRFIGGLGRVGSYAIAICYVMEFTGKKFRSAIGLGMGLYFGVGYCIYPWVAKAFKNDTYFTLALVLPNLLYYSYWWILPESPRWLLVHGRYEEADKAIRWMARFNRRTIDPLFKVENIEVEMQKKEAKTILDVFRGPILRKRILIIFYLWFVVVLQYFAVALNVNFLPGNIYLNTFFLALMEFPGQLLSIFLTNWDKMGRRRTCVCAVIGQGLCGFISLPLLKYDFEVALLVVVLVGRILQSASFGIIFFWTPELFPTEVRNTVVGAASTIGRVSGMMASFVGGPLTNVWWALPNVIYGILGTSSGLLCILLPETLGVKLSDTIDESENRIPRKSRGELPELKENKVAV